jgi:soluble lytic murein transglycosylase-like protein
MPSAKSKSPRQHPSKQLALPWPADADRQAASKPAAAKRPPSPKKIQKKKGSQGKKTDRKPANSLRRNILLLAIEATGLTVSGTAAIIALLGFSASRFSGTSLFSSLLPFAAGILCCVVVGAVLLISWRRLRTKLQVWWPPLPAAVALTLALAVALLVRQGHFVETFGYYRTLVGGKAEASRLTLAHQVYAAYRRMETGEMKDMVERATPYRPAITEAARAFDIDVDLLQGLAATESSFMPRVSRDGGQGLFQITRVPDAAKSEVDDMFASDQRLLTNPRYNAHLGAATLRYYLDEMKDDLFLGLLAYNIGPANGGLRFIMEQYGATDFVTIQPYLQRLPRDYPIRVLSYSLAFRIQQREGQLLAYEEGRNAQRIQNIGIPGINPETVQ